MTVLYRARLQREPAPATISAGAEQQADIQHDAVCGIYCAMIDVAMGGRPTNGRPDHGGGAPEIPAFERDANR
ncbi:hypothetical protein [Sphingopyxis solisilvae]|uniref:hypothetical protein n=1 Tax=Sphingopyxis solisilvae TaxID=1886788 RepID=UPI001892CD8F|nr:hypothetical protein [Sphingopyxis solisilvae]